MLKNGHMYLVIEKRPDKSFGCFMNHVKDGFHGLCISRQHPKSLKIKYLMTETPILWLTTATGNNYVNPVNIGILTNFTVNFMENNAENSVIIIDGIEYLSTYNDFVNVLKSVYFIHEVAMRTGAIVIIPVSPGTFGEKEMALLEREAEVTSLNR